MAHWQLEWQNSVRREIALLPTGPVERAAGLYRLGRTLLEREQYAEVEPLLRECLAIRERVSPEHWTTYNARSYLGASLSGQQKYDEAEPLLLSGYQGMIAQLQQIDSLNQRAPEIALERLIQLYKWWDKPDEAQKWKIQLDFATSSQD
jgi:serine/threonine-protein kinase